MLGEGATQTTTATAENTQMLPSTVNDALEGPSDAKKPRTRQRKECKYFNKPCRCWKKNTCRNRHVPKQKSLQEPAEGIQNELHKVDCTEENVQDAGPSAEVFLPTPRNGLIQVTQQVTPRVQSVTEEGEEQRKLREMEINYFHRRFPDAQVFEDNEATALLFTYNITEPEWPFDVRCLRLFLLFPQLHPLVAPRIDCPFSENQDLPQPLLRHISVTLQRYIENRHSENEQNGSYTLYGKWFTYRVDRTILALFVDGLRKTKMIVDAEKAGITLVMPNQQRTEETDNDQMQPSTSSVMSSDEESEEDDGEEEDEEDSEEDSGQEEESTNTKNDTVDEPFNEKPTMEVHLSWSDEAGSVATLEAETLRFIVMCARCGEIREEQSAMDGKKRSTRCRKCNIAQSITCHSSVVHSSSPSIALLSPLACRPIDCILMQSKLFYTCLSCNRRESVQLVNFGQPHKSWCRSCNELIRFVIKGVRFMGEHEKKEDHEAAKIIPKIKKPKVTLCTQSAPVVEGQPLPKNGACKHYAKSHRWFRFPCCGRLYPCDNCHDEAVKGEHETKVANRIVCGYCSHEQTFKPGAPCVKCDSATTKRRSIFWEGGNGCRDKISLSKNCVHRFTSSSAKTVSKKGAAKMKYGGM